MINNKKPYMFSLDERVVKNFQERYPRMASKLVNEVFIKCLEYDDLFQHLVFDNWNGTEFVPRY